MRCPADPAPGEVVLTSFGDRRDRSQFAAAYADPETGITTGPRPPAPVCVGPITYTGHDAIATDIANFKAAMQAAGVEEGFMTSIAPGSASRIGNVYYKTEEELLFACADAMREEYQAIIDAGLILQLDDPAIAENWDHGQSRADGRGLPAIRHASRRGAEPRDPRPARRTASGSICAGEAGTGRTSPTCRCATSSTSCWRSTAGAYSFEAGNVRHEHEWKVWRDVKLPDDRLILPGVVSHATNVVEHPDLVAERILRLPISSAGSG